MDTGIGLGDLLAVMNNRNGGMMDSFGSNPIMWIIVLFIIFAAIGGCEGGLFGGKASTAFTSTEFSFNNVERQIQETNKNVTDGTYRVTNALCDGFNSVGRQLDQVGYQMQSCCCETNRNIDAVRYEAAKNTCDITNAIHAEGEATRALINQNTMQELRDQLQAAQLQLGNLAQTNTLISTLRPFPQPAYITCSPYTALNGYGCGTACGCGC